MKNYLFALIAIAAVALMAAYSEGDNYNANVNLISKDATITNKVDSTKTIDITPNTIGPGGLTSSNYGYVQAYQVSTGTVATKIYIDGSNFNPVTTGGRWNLIDSISLSGNGKSGVATFAAGKVFNYYRARVTKTSSSPGWQATIGVASKFHE
jgi:hypothetical protein